jgi:uncharacterized RDD family membrane protein YckC
VGFDPFLLKAPFLLRCGALLIDYIVLIIVPVSTLLLGRWFGYDGAKLLNSPIANSGWLITLLLAVTNFLILPAVNGQSLGKILTGLKITGSDGTKPSVFSLAARHLIGYPITLLTGGLGFLLCSVTPGGRALHDYIAGTSVIYGHKTISEKRYVKKTSKAAD